MPKTVRRLCFLFFLNKKYAKNLLLYIFFFSPAIVIAQNRSSTRFIRENYSKSIVKIPMRDGINLYTVIYQPKDTSVSYPFLMERTPYGSDPYPLNEFPASLGPNPSLMREKYIFVTQDVRGRYMSEGSFKEMTPHVSEKKNNK